MKIFTTSELKERQELIDKLRFEVSLTSEVYDPDVKIWVIWNDITTGCVYDGGDITYLFQNDFPDDFDPEIIEGYGGYFGVITPKELEDMLLKIGFKMY